MRILVIFSIVFLNSCIQEPKKVNEIKDITTIVDSASVLPINRDSIEENTPKVKLNHENTKLKKEINLSDLEMLFFSSDDYFKDWCKKEKMSLSDFYSNDEFSRISFKDNLKEITKSTHNDNINKHLVLYSPVNKVECSKILDECIDNGYEKKLDFR